MEKTKRIEISMLPSSLQFSLNLPLGYSAVDVYGFHGRDNAEISEEVRDRRIRKGVLIDGVPAVIEIEFDEAVTHALCSVIFDGSVTPKLALQANEIANGLLGLTIDPEEFSNFVASDPVFGPLTKRQKGLRIAQAASVFEALTWAIMGQQINVSFAVSLRRTFVKLAGTRHSSGLLCYPNAEQAARIPLEELTSRQYSRTKAETVLRLATLIANGHIDIRHSAENPLPTICDALLAVKGVGPWTVNYALLRGYGYADCSLHGDVAVRTAIGRLWGHEVRPDIAAAEEFLKAYTPHRTMAAAHLWASLNDKAGY